MPQQKAENSKAENTSLNMLFRAFTLDLRACESLSETGEKLRSKREKLRRKAKYSAGLKKTPQAGINLSKRPFFSQLRPQNHKNEIPREVRDSMVFRAFTLYLRACESLSETREKLRSFSLLLRSFLKKNSRGK